MTTERVVNRTVPVPAWRAVAHRQTWREFGYLNLQMLIAPFAFTWTVAAVSLGAGLLVTVVGLFVPAAMVVASRGWGSMYRGLASSLLATDVVAPPARRRASSVSGTLWSMLTDAPGWRAMLFCLASLPLAILTFTLTWTLLPLGVGGLTYWAWYFFLPAQQAADGTWHRGAQLNEWFLDTPLRALLAVAAGAVVLVLWGLVNRASALVWRALTVALLAPTRAELRVAALEESRSRTVEDADARLRRIERELHDGTQARLVAVAMQLGEAKELMGTAPEEASSLLATAHASTKETLAELREIARAIHPPALEAGLEVALETLAARSAVPVRLHVTRADGAAQATPAAESIVYFGVAELVTNATKHAQATRVDVELEHGRDALRVTVRDDGRGGAAVVPPAVGTGWSGTGSRGSPSGSARSTAR